MTRVPASSWEKNEPVPLLKPKLNEPIAIVDRDPHPLQSIETKLAGDFRSQVFADGTHVHGDDPFFPEHIAKTKADIIGDLCTVDHAAGPEDRRVKSAHLADSLCELGGDGTDVAAAIEDEQARLFGIHFRYEEKQMAKGIDLGWGAWIAGRRRAIFSHIRLREWIQPHFARRKVQGDQELFEHVRADNAVGIRDRARYHVDKAIIELQITDGDLIHPGLIAVSRAVLSDAFQVLVGQLPRANLLGKLSRDDHAG